MNFYQGDTITLTASTSQTDGTCFFEFSGPSAITEKQAEPVSGGYSLQIETTETIVLTAGVYHYRAYTVFSGVVTTIETGQFTIRELGQKSVMRTALEAIEAAIAGHASRVQLQTAIGKTQIQYMTHEQLLKARAEIKTIVDAEESRDKSRFGIKKLLIKF